MNYNVNLFKIGFMLKDKILASYFEELPKYVSCSIMSQVGITNKFAHFLKGLRYVISNI